MNRDHEQKHNNVDLYQEEVGAEFADSNANYGRNDSENESMWTNGSTFSFLGILFAIMSMFIMPTTFAIIAIVLGIVGVVRHSVGLGTTAIILGAASLFMQYVWTPFAIF